MIRSPNGLFRKAFIELSRSLLLAVDPARIIVKIQMSGVGDSDLLLKMIFLGDSGIGKSNLLVRAVKDEWANIQISTIGCDFKMKTYEIDGLKVKIQMWDTAGQDRFRSVATQFYRDAGVVVLCYSLHGEKVIQNLDSWFDQIRQKASENAQVVLMRCKSDQPSQVAGDVVEQIIAEKGFKHYVTSAKTGEGVQEAMTSIITDFTRRKVRLLFKKDAQKTILVNSVAESLIVAEHPPKKRCCS